MIRRILMWLRPIIFAIGLSVVAPIVAVAQSAPSQAQSDEAATGTLQEVVVTAQRREEKQLDVPISIAVLDQQQLATANVQQLGDIAQLTPSLRFDYSDNFFQPSIRGIGTEITTSGGGSNVGIYIDGFYSPNPQASDFQLLDVSSIQVLKGPQGTLFGRNTTGGAILVTTADPSTAPHAEAKVSYGSFNAQRYEGYATTGLGGGVAVDLEGIFSKGNGFLTNLLDGNDHVGAYQNWTIRSGLKFELGDQVSVLARYAHSRVADPSSVLVNSNTDSTIDPTTGRPWGLQSPTPPGLYTVNPNQVAEYQPTFATSDNDIAQLTVKADLSFADLTSYTQLRKEDSNSSISVGVTGVPILQLALPVTDTTYTQEFLLASKPGTRFQWTGGLFFLSYRDEYNGFLNTYTVAPLLQQLYGDLRVTGSDTLTQSYAAYFDGTYELTPKLFLTAGVRYSYDVVRDAYYQLSFSETRYPVPGISGHKITPRLVLRYKPTDDSSVYASYSEGYKAAIIDVGGSCEIPPAFRCNPVQPEDVNAYEIGYKFDSHGFSTQLAAFYYDYKNQQVTEKVAATGAQILNAAQSQIYGLEGEIHYDLDRHLRVNAGASWTHARYKTFGTVVAGTVVGPEIYASCPANLATLPAAYANACGPGSYDYVKTDTILHNVPLPHSPDYTATLGPRYTTGQTDTGEYSFSGNLYFSSRFYFSPAGVQFAQPNYTTLALRAEWTDPKERYMAALYGDNVTNVRYRTTVENEIYAIGTSWNSPATWGIQVGAKF